MKKVVGRNYLPGCIFSTQSLSSIGLLPSWRELYNSLFAFFRPTSKPFDSSVRLVSNRALLKRMSLSRFGVLRLRRNQNSVDWEVENSHSWTHPTFNPRSKSSFFTQPPNEVIVLTGFLARGHPDSIDSSVQLISPFSPFRPQG